jgi:hypothetical protein
MFLNADFFIHAEDRCIPHMLDTAIYVDFHSVLYIRLYIKVGRE